MSGQKQHFKRIKMLLWNPRPRDRRQGFPMEALDRRERDSHWSYPPKVRALEAMVTAARVRRRRAPRPLRPRGHHARPSATLCPVSSDWTTSTGNLWERDSSPRFTRCVSSLFSFSFFDKHRSCCWIAEYPTPICCTTEGVWHGWLRWLAVPVILRFPSAGFSPLVFI